MARPLRIEYPGALSHVMSRGDWREAIFHDDADRCAFLETLGAACAKTGWQVHAFVLMGNHFSSPSQALAWERKPSAKLCSVPWWHRPHGRRQTRL